MSKELKEKVMKWELEGHKIKFIKAGKEIEIWGTYKNTSTQVLVAVIPLNEKEVA